MVEALKTNTTLICLELQGNDIGEPLKGCTASMVSSSAPACPYSFLRVLTLFCVYLLFSACAYSFLRVLTLFCVSLLFSACAYSFLRVLTLFCVYLLFSACAYSFLHVLALSACAYSFLRVLTLFCMYLLFSACPYLFLRVLTLFCVLARRKPFARRILFCRDRGSSPASRRVEARSILGARLLGAGVRVVTLRVRAAAVQRSQAALWRV
jgi:hypothetical protein